jgi:hypothetical protein
MSLDKESTQLNVVSHPEHLKEKTHEIKEIVSTITA